MRTTVEIPDELFRKAKAHAAMRGMKLKELIVDALRDRLDRNRAKPKGFRVKLPLIEGEPGTITEAKIKEAEEQMYDEEAKYYAQFMRRERPSGSGRKAS